ncbi:MAG: nicotinate (nicotinamide) nucleotide adenylyltransferase [Pseudomonadota bacterium]
MRYCFSSQPLYKLHIPIGKNLHIGLYGGSFNPPHEGHIRVAKTALKRLKLDKVIWLVSPQNPLKSDKAGSCKARMALIRGLTSHPKFHITDIEDIFNFKYSYQTVRALKKRYRNVTFSFIIGSDNLLTLPRWKNWHFLRDSCDFYVVARPHTGFNVRFLKAFTTPSRCKIFFINHPMSSSSSTALRLQIK